MSLMLAEPAPRKPPDTMTATSYDLHGIGVLACAPDGKNLRSDRDAVELIAEAIQHEAGLILIPVERFAAGPGYDQASGLGSLDVYNFVTQWGGAAAATSTSLAATPANINFGDTVQLTATVTAGATGFFIPTGAVTFST